MTRVLLIRHGETEWSLTRQHTGTTDLPLLPEGERAAEKLRPRLAAETFGLVLTSPLQRARRTAELGGVADMAEVDDRLREWDYGAYEGRTTSDIREERPGWDIWRDGCPGGEPVDAVGARADAVIERVLAAGVETAALVAHSHLLRILGARWIGLAAAQGGHFVLATATVCELGFERERRVIKLWNDTGHLRA